MLATLRKRYGQTAIKVVGTAGVAACSIWYGAWFPDAQQSFMEECTKLVGCKLKGFSKPSFHEVTWHHIHDFRTPVPYALIALVLASLGVINDVADSDIKERIISIAAEKDALMQELSKEKEEHMETRTEYNEAIEYILKYMFRNAAGEWWDGRCRVTIYRHTGDDQLKRIFRYAPQTQYESRGRIKIPDNEGAVGAAWQNEGHFYWTHPSSPSSKTYLLDLEKNLGLHGAILPASELTMPSREYLALAIRNLKGEKVAIVVVESTTPETINRDDISRIIKEESPQITKQIIIKSKLDETLNPDPT